MIFGKAVGKSGGAWYHGGMTKEKAEQIITTTTLYDGKILRLEQLQVQLADGSLASREVVRSNGAAAVLALKDNQVLLVRQWRTPLNQWTLELPAGRINVGEAPLVTAQRELNEETGLQAATWQPLGAVFQSAGFSDAKVHLFLATELSQVADKRPQDVGEFVAGQWLSLPEALQAQAAGLICDAKTVMGLLHWQLMEEQHGRN